MFRTLKTAIPAIILAVSATTAQAALITGNAGAGDPTSNAALTGGTVINFESVAIGNYASLTLSGVTFTNNALVEIDSQFAGSYNTRGVRNLTNHGDAPNSFIFTFAAPTNAFAFMWGAADFAWTLSAFGASGLIESHLITPTHGGNLGTYYGIAAAGITSASVSYNPGGDWVFIDNFTYNQNAVAAPAPGALALLGVGLIGLATARRKARA